jgi:translation initiation factor 1
MAKKGKTDMRGFVYSTDPNFNFDMPGESRVTRPPADQPLKVKLDSKQRGGKMVTLVQGFEGIQDDLEELGKKLKAFCGTGGSAKDGEVIVQGDQREKVFQWLLKNGYLKTKKG